jgi:hypothetical protein
VLEYLWLLNSHHEWVYKHMHGDKDTFLLAFAMAGRLGDFKQVRAMLHGHKRAWALSAADGTGLHSCRSCAQQQPLDASTPRCSGHVCEGGHPVAALHWHLLNMPCG